MSARDDLLAACAASDDVGIDLAGWSPVIRALRWWTKPGRVTLDGVLAPIADGLGDEDPDRIVQALRALLTGGLEWRPSVAQIFAQLHVPAEPSPRRARALRPDLEPLALATVRRRAADGAHICGCVPRSPQLLMDGAGVITCPDCGGLEYGQYETALESPTLGETAG